MISSDRMKFHPSRLTVSKIWVQSSHILMKATNQFNFWLAITPSLVKCASTLLTPILTINRTVCLKELKVSRVAKIPKLTYPVKKPNLGGIHSIPSEDSAQNNMPTSFRMKKTRRLRPMKRVFLRRSLRIISTRSRKQEQATREKQCFSEIVSTVSISAEINLLQKTSSQL